MSFDIRIFNPKISQNILKLKQDLGLKSYEAVIEFLIKEHEAAKGEAMSRAISDMMIVAQSYNGALPDVVREFGALVCHPRILKSKTNAAEAERKLHAMTQELLEGKK